MILVVGCGQDTANPVQGDEPITLPSATQTPTAQSSPTGLVDPAAEIEVEDQAGDGRSVQIELVHFAVGQAFLVITDLSGNQLSATQVNAGAQPVTVELDPPVTATQELIATLHLDTGDGTFDMADDTVMLDDESEPVEEDFDYVVP